MIGWVSVAAATGEDGAFRLWCRVVSRGRGGILADVPGFPVIHNVGFIIEQGDAGR